MTATWPTAQMLSSTGRMRGLEPRVNWRRIGVGEGPILALSFNK